MTDRDGVRWSERGGGVVSEREREGRGSRGRWRGVGGGGWGGREGGRGGGGREGWREGWMERGRERGRREGGRERGMDGWIQRGREREMNGEREGPLQYTSSEGGSVEGNVVCCFYGYDHRG